MEKKYTEVQQLLYQLEQEESSQEKKTGIESLKRERGTTTIVKSSLARRDRKGKEKNLLRRKTM